MCTPALHFSVAFITTWDLMPLAVSPLAPLPLVECRLLDSRGLCLVLAGSLASGARPGHSSGTQEIPVEHRSDALASVMSLDPEEERGRVLGADGRQESARPIRHRQQVRP